MELKTLQKRLLEAYSVKNLNIISLTLIDLYKNGHYDILQKIADIIGDFVQIDIGEKGKGFARLMMLYHPDKAGYHTNEINRLSLEGNFDELLNYSHILKLERIDEIASSLNSIEDIDYSPVYEWDLNAEGFRVVNDTDDRQDKNRQFKRKERRFTFYDAIKIRYYGNTKQEYPTYYLEDTEEFELSGSSIDDLDGIQYCIHTRVFDLSENYIHDLSLLSELYLIEELNLSDNELSEIEPVSNLINLRTLILSNNKIRDISPLYTLENLQYADLSGNDLDNSQIETLKNLGVDVLF